MSLNVVAISGNLCKDPETREVGDTSVTQLRVAVNNRAKVDGEWTEKPGFYDVSVWGAQGENCAKFLAKGRQVNVSGRLDWREWEDGEGNKRQAVQIVASDVQFIGGKQDGESAPAASASDEPSPF
jgi:single-strand DNA-binding protein